VAALALAALPAVAPAADRPAFPPPPASAQPRPFSDVRTPTVRARSAPGAAPLRTLSAGARVARGALLAHLGGHAVLDADPITATPRVVGRLDGALTGPQAGNAAEVALGYVGANAAALGLGPADLAGLRLARRTTAGGVTYLRWRQEAGGVPLLDNDLRMSVDADGRVITLAGAPRAGLDATALTPAVSATDARAAVARDAGVDHAATITSGPSGPRRETIFSTGDRAALVLFGDTRGVRLAWEVTYEARADAWYDTVVDAGSGAILRRSNLAKGVDGLVFGNYPGAETGGAQTPVTLDDYLTDPATATTLDGPNAHVWSDLDDASVDPAVPAPDPGEDVAPGAYPFESFNGSNVLGACDAGHLCSWDAGIGSSWETNRAQNAVQVFWSVNRFHDHLAAEPIGFDAASGNFEAAGGDALVAQTDDGATTRDGVFPDVAHLDNANMVTLPDGQSPVMQMYLFFNNPAPPSAASPFRDVNGGDDASIVYHEYTHGLSNRLITTATGAGALDTLQAAAMGEGWSDWYAKDEVVAEGLQPDTAAPGEIDMGGYVDASATAHGIRTEAIDCPVDADSTRCPGTPTAGSGGYTFGDLGRITAAGDVHANGEIWAQTLWDLRDALGSRTAQAVITGGMRLSPPQPSILEERNAILQADVAAFGGVHVDAIWTVFARRGMGFAAATAGSTDPRPVEDFSPPPTGGAGGRATVATGGATPQAVPASAVARVRVLARPTATVAGSRVRGRATFTVGCSNPCQATATMTVARDRARRARLSSARVARVTRRLPRAARRSFGLAMSATTLRRLRAAGIRSLPVTVTVSVRDGRRQTRSVHRRLTVRVR
jgi:extracellular elastinolytic metalloproteinase